MRHYSNANRGPHAMSCDAISQRSKRCTTRPRLRKARIQLKHYEYVLVVDDRLARAEQIRREYERKLDALLTDARADLARDLSDDPSNLSPYQLAEVAGRFAKLRRVMDSHQRTVFEAAKLAEQREQRRIS